MRFIRESIAKRSVDQTAPNDSQEDKKVVPVDAAQAAMDAIKVVGSTEVQERTPRVEPVVPEPAAEVAGISPEPQEEQAESVSEPEAEQIDMASGSPAEQDESKAAEEEVAKVETEAQVEVNADVETVKAAAAAAVDKFAGSNIWDMGDDDDKQPAPVAKAEVINATPRTRRPVRRNKTRILGFEPQDTTVNALFEAEEQAVAVKNVMSMKPTGWLIVVAGPGRGASFPLFTGMSQIGRSEDQTISLDFGDTAISRANHASIAYDPVEHKFYFGHGGKSNLVRLNGKPVLSTEVTKDGDEFMIGETTLRLRTLCGPDFNWETSGSEGDGHVAIA